MSTLILFNKPFGVLSQFTDDQGRPTLAPFIKLPEVYPAGRLDNDSEGLLLLTDDGALQHHIAHPSHKLPKTYWAQVEGAPNSYALTKLRQGVELNDGITLPAEARLIPTPKLWERDPPIRSRQNIPTQWIELTITEGKNRQVRRMTAAVGHPTLRLVRVKIGEWTLEGIAPGEYKSITVTLPKAAQEEAARHSRPRNDRRPPNSKDRNENGRNDRPNNDRSNNNRPNASKQKPNAVKPSAPKPKAPSKPAVATKIIVKSSKLKVD